MSSLRHKLNIQKKAFEACIEQVRNLGSPLFQALFGTSLQGKAFSVCIKDGIFIDDCCGSGRLLRETFNIPVCRVHTLCTPPSFRLPSARCNTPICSLDGAFSLHSTNGRKQKSRQNALLPRHSAGYRVQNKNASIVSILTFLYGGGEGS